MRSGEVPVEQQYKGLSGPAKQAGLTVEERQSFSKLLEDSGLIDAFRAKHPEALGVFSYYSQRRREPGHESGIAPRLRPGVAFIEAGRRVHPVDG